MSDDIKFVNPLIRAKYTKIDGTVEEVTSYKINGTDFPCAEFEVEVIVRPRPKPRFPVGTVLKIDEFPSWLYSRQADSWYWWKSGRLEGNHLWRKTDTTDEEFQEYIRNGTAKIIYSPISGK
jgi:hypothetical protein